jgi:hypothetical protein
MDLRDEKMHLNKQRYEKATAAACSLRRGGIFASIIWQDSRTFCNVIQRRSEHLLTQK